MTAYAAIQAEGLTKRYGDSLALDHLDLEVAQGEVVGYLGPNGAGKTTTIRLLLALSQPTSGHCRILGLDCLRHPVETHRRLGFVAGEANLWPSLTGAETLALLGRVHGETDVAYRDQLIDRFDLDPNKEGACVFQGKPPEGDPDRRADGSARSPHPGRANQRIGSFDGARIPPLHRRSP